MTKQKRKQEPVKEVKRSALDIFKSNNDIKLIPEPTRKFNVGDNVFVGKGQIEDAVIKEVYEDGLYYLVSYKKYNEKLKEFIYSEDIFNWLKIHDGKVTDKKFFDGNRLRINYMQMHLQSLFVYVYSFGVNFEPSYQRDFVWTDEDKESLIDSIFNHVDIGKFAFVESSKTYEYEVLDGKQRLRALCDYYEGRFAYKGVYYHELQESDKAFFLNYNVNVALFKDLTHEEKLLYFLKMNHSGKVMDANHLEKIKKEYESLKK